MSDKDVIELTGGALETTAEAIREALGDADRARLDPLLSRFKNGRASLGACLKALYPKRPSTEAQASFRQFRQALGRAAKKSGIAFALCVDSKKRTTADKRECWFEGADLSGGAIEKWTGESIRDTSGKPIIRSRAISELVGSKRPIRLFVSYAHDDEKHVERLMKLLRTQMQLSSTYAFEDWTDHRILIGKKWREEIRVALDSCDFGILMLSPNALASEFITSEELPALLGAGDETGEKPIIPIAIDPVRFDGSQDTKGVEEHQAFTWKSAPGKPAKCFAELREESARKAFAAELCKRIEERLNDWFKDAPYRPGLAPTKRVTCTPPASPPDESIADHFLREDSDDPFIRSRGAVASLRHGPGEDHEERGEDAIQFLEKWLADPNDPPFCAVLGEYGIGKSTTLQNFCRELLKKRKKSKSVSQPIYLDLRLYQGSLSPIPTLEQILEEIIRRNWKLAGQPTVTPAAILRAVREQGALIVFDGLDEKIVSLDTAGAQAFIRELWKALPPALAVKDGRKRAAKAGKLIISCRSHYFRDVVSQNAMLTGEGRDGIEADQHYRALFMLPFADDQIRAYLAALPGVRDRVDAVMDTIASIHNLGDLAKRPYLLSLIVQQIGELEKMRASGKSVQAVDLYDLIVREWLARDNGKHQIGSAHKRMLMEHLAAAMWGEGARSWDADRLEGWLDEFLAATPAVAGAYANKPREVLKEDLRTSTFVLRPDSEEKNFRFAHTSMQEYFLAVYLVRALREGASRRWTMPRPSRETFDFVGQLLRIENDDRCQNALRLLLEGNRPRATLNAFHYWLNAGPLEHPRPHPVSPDLRGENLEDVVIAGTDASHPLSLPQIVLEGAWLPRARFAHVNMPDAVMTRCSAMQAEFTDVLMPNSDARAADFTATVWRDCYTDGLRLDHSNIQASEWIRTSGKREHGAQSLSSSINNAAAETRCAVLRIRSGHISAVSAVSYSPDGLHIVSASSDKTLRVWESSSGRLLHVLKGHGGGVSTVEFSPDGTRLLSASHDASIRIWDFATGGHLLTITGHNGGIASATFSRDGTRIVSTGGDKTVRVWATDTGEQLLCLRGHKDATTAATFSIDGMRIVSASGDRSLRIWDSVTGLLIRTLREHLRGVTSVAFCPNGTHLVSASHDSTVCTWDAETGRLLHKLVGHAAGVNSVTFSRDGGRIASASKDNTVRVWESASGRPLSVLRGHSSAVSMTAFSPNGSFIVSASHDNSVRVWDSVSGQRRLILRGSHGRFTDTDFSPDGSNIVSACHDRTLRVWDSASGRLERSLTGHADVVTCSCYSPNGSWIASASRDRTVRIWDSSSGRELRCLQGHGGWVTSIAFSPNSSLIASASWDKSVRIWDADWSGQCRILAGHRHGVASVSFSPDGAHLVSGSRDRTIRVWTVESGRQTLAIEGHVAGITSVAYSPDGTQIISTSKDGTIRIWDSASGRQCSLLRGHMDGVSTAVFSPDGSKVVSTSRDNTVRMWEAVSGKELRLLGEHFSTIASASYSSDGRFIVLVSSDNALHIYDSTTGILLRSIHVFRHAEYAVLNLPQNKILGVSPGAWRYLEWRVTDPETGKLTILPAEHFGPLPTFE